MGHWAIIRWPNLVNWKVLIKLLRELPEDSIGTGFRELIEYPLFWGLGMEKYDFSAKFSALISRLKAFIQLLPQFHWRQILTLLKPICFAKHLMSKLIYEN